MKITYNGSLAEGKILDPSTGASYNFKRGEAIEVPEALGKMTLVNPDWKESGSKEKGK
jgi:hypothetical protein